MKTKSSSRRFQLFRDQDASGVSGTGLVAEGIEFTSGMVAMTWLSQHRCVNVYENMKTVEELHGHDGMTRIVYVDKIKSSCRKEDLNGPEGLHNEEVPEVSSTQGDLPIQSTQQEG